MLAVLAATVASWGPAQDVPTGRYRSRAFVLTLSGDGRYTFVNNGRTIVGGAYRTQAGMLELRDDTGPLACPDSTGRYRWRLAADTLRLDVVEDSCTGRRGAVTGGTWARFFEALVLRNATVIDGTGAPPRPGMTLVLQGSAITALGPDGALPLPEDAAVRDLSGGFVLPGLIDAHVHLATDPSGRDGRERVERMLRAAALGGVVAVRDMAGDGRVLADLARAAAVGDIVAPQIRYAALMAGPAFFDDPRARTSSAGVSPGAAPWARAIADTTDLRQAVAEARGTGAAAIKLYGALDSGLVRRVSAEAHRQDLKVWAHAALFPARPSEVAAGGVDVVSHANLLLWEAAEAPLGASPSRRNDVETASPDHPAIRRLLALMARRNVIFEPTLNVFRADSAAPDTSRARRMERLTGEMARAAHRAGVRIVAGTDGMISAEDGALPNLHQELALLVERAGLTPMEALLAATRTAAAAIGMLATHGTVEVGKAADLLVLRADPTADIRNTRQILFVIRRGQVLAR